MWVVATRDFKYDEDLAVKNGQVFTLRQCPNDGLLLKHRLVVALDPQPTADEVAHLPTCGACGAHFQEEWQRDRCGRQHELTAAELAGEHRAKRKTQAVDPRSRAGRRLRLAGVRA